MTVQTTANKAVTMGSMGMKEIKNMIKKQKVSNIQLFNFLKVEFINHSQIKASSYNEISDVTVERIIDTIHNHEFQTFLIPMETVKKIKGVKKDSLYTLDVVDNTTIKINDNGIEQTLMTMDVLDYPRYSDLIKEDTTSNGTINHADLIKLKNATISVSKQEARPILMNVLIKNEKAVSTDSHRLFQTVLEGVNGESDILLSQSLIETIEACEGKDKGFIATIVNDGNYVRIESHNAIYTAKMSEGNYPDTSRLIPSDFKNIFTIEDVKHFTNVTETIYKLVKDDRNTVMNLEILDNKTIVISGKTDTGEATSNISISAPYGIEEGFRITFSAKYLLDGIKQLDNPKKLEISFMGNLRPFILKDVAKQDTLSLILPVRPS